MIAYFIESIIKAYYTREERVSKDLEELLRSLYNISEYLRKD